MDDAMGTQSVEIVSNDGNGIVVLISVGEEASKLMRLPPEIDEDGVADYVSALGLHQSVDQKMPTGEIPIPEDTVEAGEYFKLSKINRDHGLYIYLEVMPIDGEIKYTPNLLTDPQQIDNSHTYTVAISGRFVLENSNREDIFHEGDINSRVGYGLIFAGEYVIRALEDKSVWLCVTPIEYFRPGGVHRQLRHKVLNEGDIVESGVLVYGQAELENGEFITVGDTVKEPAIVKTTSIIIEVLDDQNK